MSCAPSLPRPAGCNCRSKQLRSSR
jgi:hypothetical protein